MSKQLNTKFTVVRKDGIVLGSLNYAEDASFVVAGNGEGTELRYGRHTVWTEGTHAISAGESADQFARIVNGKVSAILTARDARATAAATLKDAGIAPRVSVTTDETDADAPAEGQTTVEQVA